MSEQIPAEGDSGNQGVDVASLLAFMDGTTLEELNALSSSIRTDLHESADLAQRLGAGSVRVIAAAIQEIMDDNPDALSHPALKKIVYDSKPKHAHQPLLDAAIEADVPAYLYGEAGSGKSTAAEHAAEARDLALRAISLCATTSKTEILGYRDANGNYQSTGFREIYEDGGIFLFDEMDNGNPGITSVINRAIANFTGEFPDGAIERNWNTRIIAAANTIGKGATAQYVGRNPIDAATLDRFAMIPWDIDEALETQIMGLEIPDDEKNEIDISEGGIPSDEEWLNEVRGFRSRAAANGLKVVISTRASFYGRKLAHQGVGVSWLQEMLIFKGIKETDKKKIAGTARSSDEDPASAFDRGLDRLRGGS